MQQQQGSYTHNMPHQGAQQDQTPAGLLAQRLMSGLRPVLLGAGQGLQLLACQVIATVALQAPAQLLQQLMLHEACEVLFEVVRGTLANCSMAAQLLASAAAWDNGSVAEVAKDEEQEAVQVAALTCLQCLAKQGGLMQAVVWNACIMFLCQHQKTLMALCKLCMLLARGVQWACRTKQHHPLITLHTPGPVTSKLSAQSVEKLDATSRLTVCLTWYICWTAVFCLGGSRFALLVPLPVLVCLCP